METGNVTQWDENIPAGASIETMDYDPVSGLIFGLGFKPNGTTSFMRTLVSFDPVHRVLATVGNVRCGCWRAWRYHSINSRTTPHNPPPSAGA